MSIIWPPGIPQAFDAEGLTIIAPDNTIRQQMEVGPPKSRQRDTSAPYKVSGKVTMTIAQYLLFETFYEETTRYGSLSFAWVHPYTLAAKTMKFSSTPKVEDADGAVAITIALEMRK